jgi:hypothetical protein
MRTALLSGLALCILGACVCGVASKPVAADQSTGAKATPPKSSEDTVKSVKPVSQETDTLGPIGVFADIEEGWKKEDVRQILRHYGSGKVAIAIEGIGPTGGQFSKNQSHYLLKDLFKYTITTKFEFVQYRNVSDDRVKVYAVAERAYKRNDDGRLFEDKIYVSLQLEDDLWVISEIKSVR